MEKLRINNPCPMLLARMQQNGEQFTCNSCKKVLTDFRDKSPEEIARTIQRGNCGIFNTSQLSQPQRSFLRKGLFAGLTVLSFLGFNVSPLHAAPTEHDQTSIPAGMLQKSKTGEDEKPKKKKKKKKNRRSRKERAVVGYI